MRINLKCGNDIRIGYINVDKHQTNQGQNNIYKQGDISNLDWLTENDTVEEILALDCLQYLRTDTIPKGIDNWYRKLSSGGILKILVPDCYAVSEAFVQGQINMDEYSQITFGVSNDNDSRLSMIDRTILFDMLEKSGLTITLKRYEGISIYVEAIK